MPNLADLEAKATAAEIRLAALESTVGISNATNESSSIEEVQRLLVVAKEKQRMLEQEVEQLQKEKAKLEYRLLHVTRNCLYDNTNISSRLVGSRDAPMIDLIFAVEDPIAWHAQNLQRNRDDYSLLASLLGPSNVSSIADTIGAGVWFNPLVLLPFHPASRKQQLMIKYGVVSISSLTDDLKKWTSLYLAGRLQKPVLTLNQSHHAAAVAEAQAVNLQSALRAALLLLPERFKESSLFRTICSLSYVGDLRMMLFEDNRKIERIVEGSWGQLQTLYRPPLTTAQHVWKIIRKINDENNNISSSSSNNRDINDAGVWEQDVSRNTRRSLLEGLPAGVLSRLKTATNCTSVDQLADMHTSRGGKALQKVLASTVRWSSGRQAVSGVISAGPVRSCSYMLRKMLKAWR